MNKEQFIKEFDYAIYNHYLYVGVIIYTEGNPSNEFYKHIGGKFIKKRVFEKLNLPENVYYFDNI